MRILKYILLVCALMLCGCTRTIYTPMETVRYNTDTLRLVQQRTDSIVLHDSVSLITRNDTVFYTKFRERTRIIERVDTVYKHRVDTARISIPYPVEKSLTWWERTKMTCSSIAAFVAIVAVVGVVVRLVRKFR